MLGQSHPEFTMEEDVVKDIVTFRCYKLRVSSEISIHNHYKILRRLNIISFDQLMLRFKEYIEEALKLEQYIDFEIIK